MKHILVATDGSDGADRAIDAAVGLAKDFDADLLIANVMGGYGFPLDVFKHFTRAQQPWLDELFSSVSAEILEKAQSRARKLGATRVRLESRTGDVAQTIIEIAQQKEIDAIVVGKRGWGRLAGMMLGSVSQKLVSLAPCMVVVVP
jgi:nucleotide-binding universal stress UspA family protein